MDAVWIWDEDRKCLKTVHVDKYGIETVIERTMDEEKDDIQVRFFLILFGHFRQLVKKVS